MNLTHRLFRYGANGFAFLVLGYAALAAPRPIDLRCEYLPNPPAIDAAQPRLSWRLAPGPGSVRGQRQTACEILVATTPDRVMPGKADLWESGKLYTSQSVLVPYGGTELRSGQDCFWKVRVFDERGKPSAWSEAARWRMGLRAEGDWGGAKWVGRDEQMKPTRFAGASWIWFPEGRPEQAAPVGTRYFRRRFEMPEGRVIKSAHWMVSGDNQYTAYVNGEEVGTGASFKTASDYLVTERLRPGNNVLAALVKNVGDSPNPAGLAALLKVEFAEGEPLVIATDETWHTSAEEFGNWKGEGYDDSTWLDALKLGALGMQPWGEVSCVEDRRLPARWLRKEFEARRKIARATVWMSGLGSSELYLNGRKVGDAVLSPGLTEYDKTVFYVTHDVTSQIQSGMNAVGVVLGNGRYFAPRAEVPTQTRSYGFPKLLFKLRLDYRDGSAETVVSDTSWLLTTNGPIRANCEYDGEEYDARMEMRGWAKPGFRAADWQLASEVAEPGGKLVSQPIPPIRVIETLKPLAVTEPQPGTFIFDMGQNMVGWCRIKVSGPAGTAVKLRHAEVLKPDGTLYLDNIRLARVTDLYTLKGNGREVYEPRFTYHGFRYVEVTGFPGKPTLDALEGRVLHDDLERAGHFTCSNPLLNRIYSNIVWGVRGNYRSIPTDCPQRDERQGWLGDRAAECQGEAYLYNMAPLYAKWLGDMADAQKPSGSVPDVCPSYWPIYSDNVTWPSATVIIPGILRNQFGDQRIIERHYASAKKWVNYMESFVTNGIISRDSYGDWCVPPEDPKLIHSNDPARKTNPALLATAYLYHDAMLMAGYALQLGKTEDEQHFRSLAATLKQAFNSTFFREADGQYDNGSQTSCVLPLAFGLVPPGQRERVFEHLVRKITQETKDHIGTGLIGGQWLMRTLSENGRADLALTIASQHDYPSWGYMVEKGATTVWELWNGDTADPAMNSGNHVMLVGDLAIWMHENLAGIRSDPLQPGFKHIVMRPEALAGLHYVRASHLSPQGLIVSDWSRSGGVFRWNITVPPNSTATVFVPAKSEGSVREAGKAAATRPGVTFIGMESDRAVFAVGSGQYRFEAR